MTVYPKEPRGDATDSTRLLCAAAYIDEGFAGSLIDGTLRSTRQAVAPHFGVDIEPVLLHCLAAQRRRRARDFALGVFLLLAIVAVWSGMTPLYGTVVRLLVLSWAVVLLLECLDRFEMLPTFQPNRFDAAAAPPASPAEALTVAEVSRLAHGDVTVYRGFVPFAGAGLQGETWSFVTDISRGIMGPDGPRTPRTFTVESLYAEITKQVRDLGIPSLEVEDRIFLNGADAAAERWLFPGRSRRPETDAPDGKVEEVMRSGAQRVRHYLTMRIVDWRGEMVVSMHLRFVISGNHLYTEASYCLVPPLRESFRKVDGLSPAPDWRSAATVIGRSIVKTLPALALAPFRVITAMFSGLTDSDDDDRDPLVDHGANLSARELAMSTTKYLHYFQKVDHDMHTKLIEFRMLDALNVFLEDHGIDTERTRQQQVNIINSGVLMTGGVINTETMAVGARARAKKLVRTMAAAVDGK
ncbi:MAG TPA: hypothetical protein VN408_00280 [Actinoplanes sp.]|nr:hypothetical protein [Actinoplanes sp.]